VVGLVLTTVGWVVGGGDGSAGAALVWVVLLDAFPLLEDPLSQDWLLELPELDPELPPLP
jgi:hypothetical protein